MRTTAAAGFLASLGVVLLIACSDSRRSPTAPSPSPGAPIGGNQPPAGPSPPPQSPPFSPSGVTAHVIAVGDVGMCSQRQAVAGTAALIDRFPGTLLLAGDLAYMHGTLQNFHDCFDPSFGHFRGRWHPVPGNHEYETTQAEGYRQYFGPAATPNGRTFYSLRLGDWLVLMLDSSISTRVGSEQYEFVRATLSSTRPPCTIAVWHHPLFSSGPNGPNTFMREMWALLYNADADVVVSGHDHLYERFSKQDPEGRPDARGLRQFVVGTGGAQLYEFQRQEVNSQARYRLHGVMRLALMPTSYQWAFVDTSGATLDAGADGCH